MSVQAPVTADEVKELRERLEQARDWIRALADDLERWAVSARDRAKDIDDVLGEQR